MKNILIFFINVYQKMPTRSHSACYFLPTCSQYTKESIEKYGVFKGLYFGTKRILRCHPWQKHTYDPVK